MWQLFMPDTHSQNDGWKGVHISCSTLFGGLVNVTHKEWARTKWLLTAHLVAWYREALRKLTENAGGTCSEQHRELYQCSRVRDHDELQNVLVFRRSHNPLTSGDPTQLRNTSTGVVADHRVNSDDALNIGAKIQ